MAGAQDWNQQIIDEFRSNGGEVGGQFAGAPMILVHHRGRTTGTARVNPLMYQPANNGFAVFASKAGALEDPDWYRNLLANPETTVEVGSQTLPVRARVLTGEERHRVWEKQKQDYPRFADYEEQTRGVREIPVVLLERSGAPASA